MIDKKIMVHSFWHFKPRQNAFSTFWVWARSKVRRNTRQQCLGQPAQILLDSALLTVRPAIIDKRRVQSVGTIFPWAFHQRASMQSVVFRPSSSRCHVLSSQVNKWQNIYYVSGFVHQHLSQNFEDCDRYGNKLNRTTKKVQVISI